MSALVELAKNPANYELVKNVRVFAVSAIPDSIREKFSDSSSWDVNVEFRGSGKWVVLYWSKAYDANLRSQHEPQSSSRTDEFIKNFRHDLPTALDLAEKLSKTVVKMGMDYKAFIAWTEDKDSDAE